MAVVAKTKLRSAAGSRRWTYEDYLQIPDDGQRYEIIWGELHVVPSPIPAHQRIAISLASLLLAHVRSNRLGEVYAAPLDVVLAVHNVVQPDVLFIAQEHLSIVTATNVTGAPDLVVEVLSPGTAARDRSTKRDAYAAARVPHYWLADPRSRSLEDYELRQGSYTLVYRGKYVDLSRTATFAGVSSDHGQLC